VAGGLDEEKLVLNLKTEAFGLVVPDIYAPARDEVIK